MYTCGKMPTHFIEGCLGDNKKMLTNQNLGCKTAKVYDCPQTLFPRSGQVKGLATPDQKYHKSVGSIDTSACGTCATTLTDKWFSQYSMYQWCA